MFMPVSGLTLRARAGRTIDASRPVAKRATNIVLRMTYLLERSYPGMLIAIPSVAAQFGLMGQAPLPVARRPSRTRRCGLRRPARRSPDVGMDPDTAS